MTRAGLSHAALLTLLAGGCGELVLRETPDAAALVQDTGPRPDAVVVADAGGEASCDPVVLLADGFDGSSLSDATWSHEPTGSTDAVVRGGNLVLHPTSGGTTHSVQSVRSDFDLRAGEVVVQLSTQLVAHAETAIGLALYTSETAGSIAAVTFYRTRNSVGMQQWSRGGEWSEPVEPLMDAATAAHPFMRIRSAVSGGVQKFWFDTSADGMRWQSHFALPLDFATGSVAVKLIAEPITGATIFNEVRVDNVEVTAAPAGGWCKAARLIDGFDGDELAPRWRRLGEPLAATTENHALRIQVAAAAETVNGMRVRGVATGARYDLEGSDFVVDLGDLPFLVPSIPETKQPQLVVEVIVSDSAVAALRLGETSGEFVVRNSTGIAFPLPASGPVRLRFAHDATGFVWAVLDATETLQTGTLTDDFFERSSVQLFLYGVAFEGLTAGTSPVTVRIAGVNAE